MINDVCVECPLGYIKQNSKCLISQSLVFNLTFNTKGSTVIDSAYNISGNAGTSGAFNPDTSNPFFSVGRGFYFNGIGSTVNFVNSSLLLAPEFTFEV